MDYKAYKKLMRKATKDTVIVADTQPYNCAECRCDYYGNKYILLSWNADAALADNPKLVLDDELDDATPVYIAQHGDLFEVIAPDISERGTEEDVIFVNTEKVAAHGISKNEEVRLLVINFLQNTIFIAIGLFIAFMLGGFVPELEHIMTFSLVEDNFINSICWIFAGVAVLLSGAAIGAVIEKAARGKAKIDEETLAQRRSVMGEIFQLPVLSQALFFVPTGFGEEVLFRFGLTSLAVFLFSFILDTTSAAVAGVFATSALFSLAHIGSYKSFIRLTIVFFHGAVLGLIWLASGSIIVASVVHALYDLAIGLIQRTKMKKNPAVYFKGLRPVNVLVSSADEGMHAQSTICVKES